MSGVKGPPSFTRWATCANCGAGIAMKSGKWTHTQKTECDNPMPDSEPPFPIKDRSGEVILDNLRRYRARIAELEAQLAECLEGGSGGG